MADIETRIEQIAQVIGQFDDAQVPRTIRTSSKEALEQLLINKNKEIDRRLGMTASIMDEIFTDSNLPIHFGPLCLQVQTVLETLLNEVRSS